MKKIFLFINFLIISVLIGCASNESIKTPPKIIVKKVYVKRKIPEIKTIKLNDLNLSEDKPLKIKFKIKEY